MTNFFPLMEKCLGAPGVRLHCIHSTLLVYIQPNSFLNVSNGLFMTVYFKTYELLKAYADFLVFKLIKFLLEVL